MALIMRVVIVVFFQFDDGIHTSLLSSCPFASPIRTSPNTFVCSDFFSFFFPSTDRDGSCYVFKLLDR